MYSAGIMIVPKEPIPDVLRAARAAEDAGFDFILIADEGFLYDVYALMAAILQNTQRIRVAPITNPFTRHPAVTAAGLTTLNHLAPGRAFLNVVPGGSLALGPMGLQEGKPLGACRDLINIVRALSTGEKQTYTGSQFHLQGAQLHIPPHPIEIWMMGRGPKMVRLSGELADVTVITSRSGARGVIGEAQAGAAQSGRPLHLAYLGSLAFNPAIMDRMRPHYTYALPDTPPPVAAEMGLDPAWLAELKRVRESQGIDAAARLISDDLLRKLMVAGTPDECVADIQRLARDVGYERFIFPVMSLAPDYALPLLAEAGQIYARAGQGLQETANA